MFSFLKKLDPSNLTSDVYYAQLQYDLWPKQDHAHITKIKN